MGRPRRKISEKDIREIDALMDDHIEIARCYGKKLVEDARARKRKWEIFKKLQTKENYNG